jgi:tetratricopeptide (TPR) repeat protein/predicted Ser/Thr protein kinase
MPEPQAARPENVPILVDLTGKSVGRFAIRARLGAGGMGEVYRADDTKMKRAVALKRIAPELRADERYRDLFRKEVERASCLNDHHIATVYDVLEERDETFLVMEYVEGSTLRERLSKPFGLKEFLPVAIQCGEALVAAEEKGVAHHDIKPENIMLTPKGQVKILDFGVAKRLPRSDDATAGTTGTKPGGLQGTPAYMAPEVLLEKVSDQRADIFSLGVVFYEMLTARHPFRAESFLVTTDRILHETPPPASQFNPQVPPALEDVIGKMTAKDPAQRYTHAAELLADLRALERGETPRGLPHRALPRWALRGVTLLVAGLAVLVALFMLARVPTIEQRLKRALGIVQVPQQKRLLVLPFSVLGGNPEVEAFSKGLIETLNARLTQLTGAHGLQVVPASEVLAQGVTTAEQARKEFGVNLVLTGSLQESGSMVRITYALVDSTTRRQLRADIITAAASDPFGVEDRVVESVLDNLEIELEPRERQALAAYGTQEARAYEEYLRGRGYLQEYNEPRSIESAINAFQRALVSDPTYALAYAALGEAYWKKYDVTKDAQWVDTARQACQQAVGLNDHLSAAYICLGTVDNGTGQYEKAREEFRRALQLEPTCNDAYRGLAHAFEAAGKLEQAEATYHKAIEVRPSDWLGYNALGVFYYKHARYTEAAQMFQRVVQLTPDNSQGYSNLGAMYHLQGRTEDAIRAYRKSMELTPNYSAASNLGTLLFYYNHDYVKAVEAYEQALAINDSDHLLWGNLGAAYQWAQQPEKARAAYQKAAAIAEKELQVNPRDPKVLMNLANYYADLKDAARAKECLRRALALGGSKDARLLFLAGTAYEELGDREQALAWLHRALDAGYSREEIERSPMLAALRQDPRFQGQRKAQ